MVEELDLTRSTMNSIWLKHKATMDTFESRDIMGSWKKIRGSDHPELETALLKWFKQILSENIAINSPLIKEKTLQVAKLLDIDSFYASKGWLMWFKNRHGLVFRTVGGEARNVTTENIKEWKKNLSCLFKDYDLKNIFNIDETGLFL